MNKRSHLYFGALLLLLSTAACSTTLEGEETGPDADTGLVSNFPDAGLEPEVEAAPCMEGDHQQSDPGDDTCYMFFKTPATWTAAQAACLGLGATLATVQSDGQQSIVAALSANYSAGSPDAWLGATDQAVEGTFLWVDDSALTYSNWRAGEPNNGGANGEDCVVIEGDNPAKEWDDRPCTIAYPYLCARAASQ